jgi:hypothetical protein
LNTNQAAAEENPHKRRTDDELSPVERDFIGSLKTAILSSGFLKAQIKECVRQRNKLPKMSAYEKKTIRRIARQVKYPLH